MMYSNKAVASVKVGGKILRENSGVVTLPFGSEYSVLLKNLSSRRAMVKVSVDGQDATEGTKLIVGPNKSIDLERFIRNGNLKEGNKFRFIERTSEIEEHRGIKEDDSLVRAEFWFEKEVIDVPTVRHHYYDEWHPVRDYWYPYKPYYPYYPYWPYNNGVTWTRNSGNSLSGGWGDVSNSQFTQSGNLGSAQKSASSGVLRAMSCSTQSFEVSEASANDTGITVPGSKSDQKFYSASGFDTENGSTVIVLQLRGSVGDKSVSQPVTVDTKPVCSTCGKTNKATDSFCGKCGTALQLI